MLSGSVWRPAAKPGTKRRGRRDRTGAGKPRILISRSRVVGYPQVRTQETPDCGEEVNPYGAMLCRSDRQTGVAGPADEPELIGIANSFGTCERLPSRAKTDLGDSQGFVAYICEGQ